MPQKRQSGVLRFRLSVSGIEKDLNWRNEMREQVDRINKILVSIDFSEYSRQVMEYAVEVSMMTKARIIVINIINQKEIDMINESIKSLHLNKFVTKNYISREEIRRKSELKAMFKEISGSAELTFKILIGQGIPSVEILETIHRENIDFLVFGHKGRSNLFKFLFGSVAEKLFKHSPIPIMSLRSGS